MTTNRSKRPEKNKTARARSAGFAEQAVDVIAPVPTSTRAASSALSERAGLASMYNGPTGGLSSITDDLVAERAYQIWMAEGCPDGRALQHWLQARHDLTAS